jgi:hypothetical protein
VALHLTTEQQTALQRLEEAENELIQLGFCIFRQAARYAEQNSHFSTRVSYHDTEMADHAFADAVRDLAVEWSNARHSSALVWK